MMYPEAREIVYRNIYYIYRIWRNRNRENSENQFACSKPGFYP